MTVSFGLHRIGAFAAALGCMVFTTERWPLEAATIPGMPPTVLWSTCDKGSLANSLTLDSLANGAKPLLWFSRDEPLISLDGFFPSEWAQEQQSGGIGSCLLPDGSFVDMESGRRPHIVSSPFNISMVGAMRNPRTEIDHRVRSQ